MKRRKFIKLSSTVLGASLFSNPLDLLSMNMNEPSFTKADFGNDFKWGAATAAYQIEGAWNVDGKGPSVWDHMTHTKPNKVKNKDNGDVACDFYNRYHSDLAILKEMNFKIYRFSIAWTRIFPSGTGEPNQKGVDFIIE